MFLLFYHRVSKDSIGLIKYIDTLDATISKNFVYLNAANNKSMLEQFKITALPALVVEKTLPTLIGDECRQFIVQYKESIQGYNEPEETEVTPTASQKDNPLLAALHNDSIGMNNGRNPQATMSPCMADLPPNSQYLTPEKVEASGPLPSIETYMSQRDQIANSIKRPQAATSLPPLPME